MIVTEKEAAEKWCPHVRFVIGPDNARWQGGTYTTRLTDDITGPKSMACIGSRCMAFRWFPDAEIVLGSNGLKVVIDADDSEWASTLSWWWDGRYPRTDQGRAHVVIFERHFGDIPEGLFVDHIDGSRLNARKGNLRLVTPSQNAANAAARGGVSKYRGVYLGASGRWRAQISKDGNRETLGTFDTEQEAAAAYDEAAKLIHGPYARLNLSPVLHSGRRGYCGLAGKP